MMACKRNYLIDVFFRVALSQSLSRAIDEGDSLSDCAKA